MGFEFILFLIKDTNTGKENTTVDAFAKNKLKKKKLIFTHNMRGLKNVRVHI